MLFSSRLRFCTYKNKNKNISFVKLSEVILFCKLIDSNTFLRRFHVVSALKIQDPIFSQVASREPNLSFNMRFLSRFPRCLVQPQMSTSNVTFT